MQKNDGFPSALLLTATSMIFRAEAGIQKQATVDQESTAEYHH
jgi:hypothetical protein